MLCTFMTSFVPQAARYRNSSSRQLCAKLWRMHRVAGPEYSIALRFWRLANSDTLCPIPTGQHDRTTGASRTAPGSTPKPTWSRRQSVNRASGAADAVFISHDGETLRELIQLTCSRLLIGRSEHNDIAINSKFISRHHALLVRQRQRDIPDGSQQHQRHVRKFSACIQPSPDGTMMSSRYSATTASSSTIRNATRRGSLDNVRVRRHRHYERHWKTCANMLANDKRKTPQVCCRRKTNSTDSTCHRRLRAALAEGNNSL